MTLPSSKDVDLALLVELLRAAKPVRKSDKEVYTAVERHFPELSEADKKQLLRNEHTPRWNNAIDWARNKLNVQGVLADTEDGIWQANERAHGLLIRWLSERGLTEQGARQFVSSSQTLGDILGRTWAKPRRERRGRVMPSPPTSGPPSSAPAAPVSPRVSPPPTPEKTIHDLQDDAIRRVRESLMNRIQQMDGRAFEKFIARVLEQIGFTDVQVVGGPGDEGVDVQCRLANPLLSATVAVQVKRRAAPVGPPAISYLRDRWAKRADKLLFITTTDFTPGAREVAADPDQKPVELVNGEHLVSLMVERGIGVRKRPAVIPEFDEEFFRG